MPRPISAAFVFLLAAMPAQEPEQKIDGIVSGLADRSPGRVAWAAHAARGADDKKLIAPLQRALRTFAEDDSDEGRGACLFLLDALVALDARLPATDLLTLLDDPRCGVPAFVLLCRESRQNEAELFELFRAPLRPGRPMKEAESWRLRRVALGDLLCGQATPGLAAHLWQQIDFRLHVRVRSPGPYGVSGMSFSLDRPDSLARLPAGFPPEPRYRFTPLGDTKTDTPLPDGFGRIAAGVRTGYQRTTPEIDDREQRLAGFAAHDGTNELAWLERLAGAQLRVGARHLDVAFTTPADYTERVQTAQSTLSGNLRLLRDALVAKRALRADEVDACPTAVAVETDDLRKDRTTPLPEIASLK